jgi:small subunit ribosomal protein S14
VARKSNIARDKKRKAMYEQYAERRASLKKELTSAWGDPETVAQLQAELRKLPLNSSPTRLHNRCMVTGRPKAYIRKFGLSRITFRELAHLGYLPGVTKSSW